MPNDVGLVMTLIGADRPGLVGHLAAVVKAHSGNWLESRMAQLGGRFAGILRISVPEGERDKMEKALRGLQHEVGLAVMIEAGNWDSEVLEGAPIGKFDLVGNDRPGIISAMSAVLAKAGVNVEELRTWTEEAPMAGGRLFHAQTRVRLAVGQTFEELRRDLEGIAEDLMVDLRLEDPGGEQRLT